MSRSKSLYNADLAPTPTNKKNWGWFEIFNVWANDVQSLFGYTLAASLFIDKRFSKETGLPVHIAEDPLSCVAIGTGKALDQEQTFSTMLTEY